MNPLILSAALDAGDRELVRTVTGLAIAIGLALLLAITTPLALLSTFGGTSSRDASRVESGPMTELNRALAGDDFARQAGDGRDGEGIVDAVEVARRFVGVPYVFGGTDPARGLDCSGLVQLVFRQLRITLPRTAQQQYAATARVTAQDLRPGDLVFFARTYNDPSDWVTHVGVYVGAGRMINAPTTGDVVREMPVFSGFWGAHYIGAGRVRAPA